MNKEEFEEKIAFGELEYLDSIIPQFRERVVLNPKTLQKYIKITDVGEENIYLIAVED